jgi:hypothetical protein
MIMDIIEDLDGQEYPIKYADVVDVIPDLEDAEIDVLYASALKERQCRTIMRKGVMVKEVKIVDWVLCHINEDGDKELKDFDVWVPLEDETYDDEEEYDDYDDDDTDYYE